jgi:alanine racemase
MTHLCCAEVAGANTTAHAMTLFAAGVQQVADAGFAPQWLHVGNTSAVDEGSTMEQVRALAASVRAQAMVRTGFALYGHCFPVERGVGALSVQPVMTWKTRVVALRTVAAGTTVGYGATFVAEREMTLALLQVGYADGFTRAASSGVGDGWVMLAGERAAVVGRVSMNLTVVDVTRMHVRVGDEAVLLGEGVSAEDHARWSGTIAYDVLCGVRAGSILTSE